MKSVPVGTRIRILGVFVGLFGAITHTRAAAAQNIVTDPGFEFGTVGAVSPPGWYHFVNGVSVGFDETVGVLVGVSPYLGVRQYTLGDNGATGGIYQTLVTTPGAFYTVTFELALLDRLSPDDPIDNSFTASWNGTSLLSLADVSSPFGYLEETFSVQAPSSQTDLRFTAQNDAAGWFIDDVSVTQSVTPEPNSVLLLGTGLVGLSGVARKRRR